MDVHATSKGRMLDTMEKFYIYKETRINSQINDMCTVKPNIVFESLILEDTDRAHITLQQPVLPHTPQSPVLITRRRTQATVLQI